jgi:hypothetical protein
MYTIVLLSLSALRDTFRSRAALQLELFALRHQLATMKRKSSRPSLRPLDRLVWVLLFRLLPARPLPDLRGKHRTEPIPPEPHCLVADIDARE